VILDEIHRVPELFQELRGLIDQGRRHGRRTGRFLLLGSASMDLLHQSGESLAGRIEYVEMEPLDVLEATEDGEDVNRLWGRGGFPDSFLADSDAGSFAFRSNFIRTYLERDVPQFGRRIPAETLERLWTMLAHSQGTLLNASKLASSLAVSAPTVTSYIDLLADLLLILELPGQHGLWAIEIKRVLAPTVSKGFHAGCQDLNPRKSVIVYAGQDRYPVSEDVEVRGIREMASMLASLSPLG